MKPYPMLPCMRLPCHLSVLRGGQDISAAPSSTCRRGNITGEAEHEVSLVLAHRTGRGRKALARVRDAQERFAKARLPIDTGRLEVLRRALALVESDHVVRRQELNTQRGVKRANVEALRIELVILELERAQAIIRAPWTGSSRTET